MSQEQTARSSDPYEVFNPAGRSRVVIVCEHASRHIPAAFHDLGLNEKARQSHIAWDPGALCVARGLAARLDAKLVASKVSRLVYDCNRPPSAPDAMPARSEAVDIPGNASLTGAQRQARADRYYAPFRARLSAAIAATSAPVIVTVHSFTPVFHGQRRSVEIGILHDSDRRLADAMMKVAPSHTSLNVAVNQPYGPQDGVTHTLNEHAIGAGHLNVMLEVRNDLIENAAQQDRMAACLEGWLTDALVLLPVDVTATC